MMDVPVTATKKMDGYVKEELLPLLILAQRFVEMVMIMGRTAVMMEIM